MNEIISMPVIVEEEEYDYCEEESAAEVIGSLLAGVDGMEWKDDTLIKHTTSADVPVANFIPVPVEDIIYDNGAERSRFFRLKGLQSRNGRLVELPVVKVDSNDISNLNWVTSEWGFDAIIYPPTVTRKDTLRSVMFMIGQREAVRKTIYTHTGWREENGNFFYLHAGGAIGNDNAEVCIDNRLERYKGKSAVAAAAYRSGEKLTNDYDGTAHDFTRKGGVVYTEILLPDNAPREYTDRSTLWNAVEAVEKSKNAQLSREIEIALPNELSEAECITLAKEFAQRTFVDKGMCADVCIHNPNREQKNIHAHIMLTMRPFNEDGIWGDKQKKEYLLDKNGNKIYDKRKRTYKCRTVQTTDWNSREKAEEWRAEWENFINSALAEKGIIEKVDHRSFERQGKIEKPTIHMGVAATQMERKGIRTVKGDTNREIKSINAKISALIKRIETLEDEIAKMKEIPKEDSLVEILMRFHDNGIKFSEVRGVNVSNLKKIAKFKDLTHLIAFVQGNEIGTLSELAEKNSKTKAALINQKSKLISTQKRMKELTELLDNYPRYKDNKAVYLEWQSITNLKKKEKFYDKHYGEITLFKTAKSFYDSNLNSAKLTPKAWQRELEELTKSAEVDRAKVEKLGDDVAVMETLIYNVQRLTNYEEKQNEIQRKRSCELE